MEKAEIKSSNSEVNEIKRRFEHHNIKPTVAHDEFIKAVKKINPTALVPVEKFSKDIKNSLQAFRPEIRRFHGSKVSLHWFPSWFFNSCSDKYGYLTSSSTRSSSKLDFNVVNQALLNELGGLMGNAGRDNGIGDSTIPAGYTYFGQFVDHDITFDVTSSIESATDAESINNMRSPALDLDNVYSRGPALDPYLYVFPSAEPLTAIKFKLGINQSTVSGGPSTIGGGTAGMQIQSDFDVPRITGTNTAVIGDPRNDENLIVSQFQAAMLKFHNAVVDLLVAASFSGDIFVEARKITRQHYQWVVVHDYLKRICGESVVNTAQLSVAAPVGSSFRMPVEFSVAAYRFGHSMIRNTYWINHRKIGESLLNLFNAVRNPELPVKSEIVVDFNAFFPTGIPVPVFNMARKIDSVLSNGLASLPGGSGIMGILAARNLRRGLAFGLPSGQATAIYLGLTPMTTAELTTGLPADELNVLNSNGGILLNKTPLWYYILREASVLSDGNMLGPVGAKIVAETFIRMLKRDANSYLNVVGGFTPFLPSATPGDFTVTDLIKFSGVNVP